MRISARCDYACKALLELALYWPKKDPLQISMISARQAIPIRYLVHILIQLKGLGLVESVRGKSGGYVLAKPPSKISLGEVTREMNGPLLPLADSAMKKGAVFAAIWKEAEESISRVLDKITFEDIVSKTKELKNAIVYQI